MRATRPNSFLIARWQISQRINRNVWRPEGDAGADASVEHPVRKYCYNTRFDLNMDDATIAR